MEIRTRHGIDDEVWVLENLGDRMRPVKRRVYAITVNIVPGGIREEYYSQEGQLSEIYPTVEIAEEALKVIEYFKKSLRETMAKVRAGDRFIPPPEGKPVSLLDSSGKEMVK